MQNIPKIALTGGPAGGKSTLMRHINAGVTQAYTAPEVATILLGGGFPAPSEQHAWSYDWQRSFQTAVAASQLALEQISLQRAAAEQKRLIIYDRGLPDGASYLRGGMAELAELTNQAEEDMLARYDLVLHLPTTAAADQYQKDSNPHRFEQAEAALALDARLQEVWQDHPNRITLDIPDETERMTTALEIVRAMSRF